MKRLFSEYIDLFKRKIKKLYDLKYLKLLKIIIYENDSVDDTLYQLKWDNDDLVISEKNIAKGCRIKNIDYGRNKLLEYIKDNSIINPNYLIMIDTDDVLTDFNPQF